MKSIISHQALHVTETTHSDHSYMFTFVFLDDMNTCAACYYRFLKTRLLGLGGAALLANSQLHLVRE